MVIGNGLIAKRFTNYINNDKFLVFASGVSNSKTTNASLYEREINLLNDSIKKYPDTTLVYFSTCSIADPEEQNSNYVKHKLAIEQLIQSSIKSYHIFRISNLAGQSSNPNTVLNFFMQHVKQGINFDLWVNACRNIIDVDDAYKAMDYILEKELFLNQVINIANPLNYPVKEIITAIESFLKLQSNNIPINKGGCFDIDTSKVQPVYEKTGINFSTEYLPALLKKYFSR